MSGQHPPLEALIREWFSGRADLLVLKRDPETLNLLTVPCRFWNEDREPVKIIDHARYVGGLVAAGRTRDDCAKLRTPLEMLDLHSPAMLLSAWRGRERLL
jgi:hypothetical protein